MELMKRRGLVKTGTLSAGILLILALLVIVNYFSWKYYKRFDWTSSKIYSLSPKSRDVLRDLHQDVNVVMLMSPEQQRNVYEPTRELLQRYAAASPHIHLQVVDPEKNAALAEQLARRYSVTTAGVVFASEKDRRVVDGSELADFDYSGAQMGQPPEMTGYKGEEQFTSAILQLGEGRKPKALFTTGHGERSLDDTGPRGLSDARELLGRDNFEIEEWASLGKPAVPPKTDLVVIAGPTGSFLPPELDALTTYVRSGGRLLILLDPTLSGATVVETGLEGWLAGYGVKVDKDIVVDPANPMPFFGSETLFVKDYAEHPITKALRSGSVPVIVSLARSVDKVAAAGAPPTDSVVTELLHTSNEGWGETDLAHLDQVAKDARDVPGPVSLGVAVEIKPAAGASPVPGAAAARGARMVIYGDSDFATKQLVEANGGNSILLVNSLNWLVERESLLGIPPRKTEQVHLSMTQGQLRTLYVISLLILPGLAAAAGIWVHFRRRR
jgi:gliding motility-associatede transport system auxiliary component